MAALTSTDLSRNEFTNYASRCRNLRKKELVYGPNVILPNVTLVLKH